MAAGFASHTGLVLDFGTGTGRDAVRAIVRSLLGLEGVAQWSQGSGGPLLSGAGDFTAAPPVNSPRPAGRPGGVFSRFLQGRRRHDKGAGRVHLLDPEVAHRLRTPLIDSYSEV